MGFGLLIYGYLMLLDVSVKVGMGLDVFPDILGYIFIYIASKKLRPYGGGFKQLYSMTPILFILGAYTLFAQIASLFGVFDNIIEDLLWYSQIAKYPVLLFMHIGLFTGIRELANTVELPKIVKSANKALAISSSYYVLTMILAIVYMFAGEITVKFQAIYGYVSLIDQLLFYIMFVYTFFLLFNCHRLICYEGEEDISAPDMPIEKLFKKIFKK